jgi:hypothetical protein
VSTAAVINVPAATRILTSDNSSNSCDGTPATAACMANLGAMGSVTTTVSGFTGCTAAGGTDALVVTPQNLPSSVWLQNAICNGVNTASLTLMTARTDTGTAVPASTEFAFLLVP